MRIANSKDRLKEAMDMRGVSQVDLANATGLSKPTISLYLSGRREPNQKSLYLLGQALNVSEVWLMGYDIDSTRNEFISIKATSSQKELLDAYVKADKSIKEAVNKLLDIT